MCMIGINGVTEDLEPCKRERKKEAWKKAMEERKERRIKVSQVRWKANFMTSYVLTLHYFLFHHLIL